MDDTVENIERLTRMTKAGQLCWQNTVDYLRTHENKGLIDLLIARDPYFLEEFQKMTVPPTDMFALCAELDGMVFYFLIDIDKNSVLFARQTDKNGLPKILCSLEDAPRELASALGELHTVAMDPGAFDEEEADVDEDTLSGPAFWGEAEELNRALMSDEAIARLSKLIENCGPEDLARLAGDE